MQKIELPLELVNALLVYLDRQPHGEVRRLIDGLNHAGQQYAQQVQAAQAAEPAKK
mgnify:FL=1